MFGGRRDTALSRSACSFNNQVLGRSKKKEKKKKKRKKATSQILLRLLLLLAL